MSERLAISDKEHLDAVHHMACTCGASYGVDPNNIELSLWSAKDLGWVYCEVFKTWTCPDCEKLDPHP